MKTTHNLIAWRKNITATSEARKQLYCSGQLGEDDGEAAGERAVNTRFLSEEAGVAGDGGERLFDCGATRSHRMFEKDLGKPLVAFFFNTA